MKKRALFLGLCLAGALVFGVPAHAQSSVEHVDRFDTSIHINADATAHITETIVYDFGPNTRHGIYRDIPVQYKTELGNATIELTEVAVADANGTAYPFKISNSGDNERLQIGDPTVTTTGIKTYVISYTVSRAISYFADYDELYWNVTGNQWEVPISEASASVMLPAAVATSSLRLACYQGPAGSTDSCAMTPQLQNGTVSEVSFAATTYFLPGSGLTVAVGFPKSVVYQPTHLQSWLAIAKDNWVVVVPLFVLVGMFALWYFRGRDPRGRGTIVPQYESPDGLAPLEMYMILHERISNAAISSEIIYLATRGYIKITKTDEKVLMFNHTDYTLTKLRPSLDLAAADKALLDGIFASGNEVKLSTLKNTFYKNIGAIKKATTASVVEKGYFASDPNKTRMWYSLAGAIVLFVSFYLNALGALTLISGVLSGAIIILFGIFMPKRTQKGAVAREQIEGLKMYMDVAEKDRINFSDAPTKNPQLFETLLPFAMVLGVEAAWAKQFEGIYTSPPSWYADPYMRGFNPILFTSNLHSFSAGAASTLASAPHGGSGSGGGGFSGGGFGGGGGGSW